jgi:class 3 adenylate cyclase
MSALPAGTVTFLLTDVEGSTRLLDELGAEAYAAARSLLVEAQSLVDRYGLEREGAFVALTSAYLALFDRDAERAEIALARARGLFETSTPGRVTLVLLPEAALHALRGDRAAALAAWDAAEALERKIGEGGMVERKLVTEFLEPLRV